ncbi:MAG TPA: DUF2071 domain-containing protein [Pirellulales bacterium]|nr:DUF2071 domain-containing protein [Pirellulales bacterium]
MKLPVIRGTIDRRILVNYRVDPEILQRILPFPFQPKLVAGRGIAGICLIRLRHIRPRGLPKQIGLSSENAAHRIAVEWEEAGQTREGVFIPRRDTSSRLNALAGGRLFPGEHFGARFRVVESGEHYSIQLDSDDGATQVLVQGRCDTQFSPGSIFGSLDAASAFFEAGSLGFSVTSRAGAFDGLELRTSNWQVQPFAIERCESNYFDNAAIFPAGTIDFDNALLMRGVAHEWHGREPLCADYLAALPAK